LRQKYLEVQATAIAYHPDTGNLFLLIYLKAKICIYSGIYKYLWRLSLL